jgi:thiol-disulfide isomerase/thioredoxin
LELRSRHVDHRSPFVLPTSNRPNIAQEAARGHIVIVHLLASWCGPCREELPALGRLAARANDKVRVLAIPVAEVDLCARRFLETTSVSFPVLLDRERTVAREWDVAALPITFILDADLRPRLVVETDFARDKPDSSKLATIVAENAGGIRPIKCS